MQNQQNAFEKSTVQVVWDHIVSTKVTCFLSHNVLGKFVVLSKDQRGSVKKKYMFIFLHVTKCLDFKDFCKYSN